jgi:hypothetical protein
MSSNSAFTASTAEEVIFPNFELLPATMLKGPVHGRPGQEDAHNHSQSRLCHPGATFYAVPMDSPALAQGPLVYLRVTGDPQTRAIFATCLAYSQEVFKRAIAVGALIHFPPPDHVLIAKANLADLIEINSGTTSNELRTGEERASKRLYTRAQAEGDETSYRTNENISDKGMSKVMFDLDGGRYLV